MMIERWCVYVIVKHSVKAADKLPFVLVEVKTDARSSFPLGLPSRNFRFSAETFARALSLKAAVLPPAEILLSFPGITNQLVGRFFVFFPQ